MSEDAPQFDESQRIEDPEKARAMAEAEAPHRASEGYHMEQATLEANRDDHDAAYENLKWAGDDEALAKEAGEEAGRQYDAEQADSLGSAAVRETQIPVTEATDSSDRVENVEKAHSMALAATDERIQAADYRRVAREQHEFSPQSNDPSLMEDYARQNEAKAEQADHIAKRIEGWAGILHDYPVSEEYEKAHPEVRFTPEGLMIFEELLQYRKDDLAKVEEEYSSNEDWGMVKLPVRLQTYVLDKPPLPAPGSENYQQRLEDAQLEPKLASLLSNPGTTLGELREYFEDLDKGQLQGWIDDAEKVLDEVRTGQTSEAISDQPEIEPK